MAKRGRAGGQLGESSDKIPRERELVSGGFGCVVGRISQFGTGLALYWWAVERAGQMIGSSGERARGRDGDRGS